MLELLSPLNPRNLQRSDPLVQDPEKNLRISWLERSQLTVFGVRWDSVPWKKIGWIVFKRCKRKKYHHYHPLFLGRPFVEKGAVSESSATIAYPHLPKFFFQKKSAHLERTEHPSILAQYAEESFFWNLDSPKNQGGTVPFFDSFSAKLTESTRPLNLPTQKNYIRTWSFCWAEKSMEFLYTLSLTKKLDPPQVGPNCSGCEDRIVF